MALDRRTIGLLALLAAILVCSLAAAAFHLPPFARIDAPRLLLLLFVGGGATVGLVQTWRARPHIALRLARGELMDAVDMVAVMILDQKGVIRHWSGGCEELYGWPAARAIGRRRIDLLESRTELPPAELWGRLATQNGLVHEVTERHRDGHELVVQDHVRRFDHGGGHYSAVIAVTDVTGTREAESALRLTEARLATAVSVQGIFIYEVDLVTRQTIWTTPSEAFFGRPIAGPDTSGSPAQWQSDYYRRIREIVDKAVAAGQDRIHFDLDFHHPDDTVRIAEGWARIIRDADGRPVRLLGTHLDVTERREREQALRAGEAERRAILATVPDAMFVSSERGVVRAASATACRLLGYAEEQLVGRLVTDLIEDGRGPSAVRRDLNVAINRGAGTAWPLPLNVRRADGEVVPISFVVGDAVVEGTRMFVVFGRDMRPAIASEEKFRRLNNDLAQVSRLGMMGEMAGALAHELSQPLSAIVNFLGAADLMLDNGEPTDAQRVRHAIHRAGEQASRAGEIIRRLRAFILRGETDMRAEPLASLVREAAALALFNSGGFGVRLSYDFESEDRQVLGDRIQIQQVLVNLIRNAADAMAAHGGNGRRDIRITTTMARDDLIEIAVEDSGPGIAPVMLERLFSPFATTKHEGLGFGLAISRRIVEAHGGQLSAAAAEAGGAVFRFTLPVMEEDMAR